MATVPTSPYLKIEVVNGKTVTLSLFEYLKLLRLAGVPGYISRVAVNPATGFSSLNLSTAHNRASGFFVCNAQSRLNYGGLSGGAERLAGDCGYRSANPAQVTTSCLAAARGGLKTLSTGAVAMTTIPTLAHAVFSCHEHRYSQCDRLRQPCTSHHLCDWRPICSLNSQNGGVA